MSKTPVRNQLPLREYVRRVAQDYLADMDNTDPENLYQLFVSTVESPLIEEVLKKTAGNQSHAARILGITRNTLRSKMRQHGIQP
ncbi:MAG: Fis family transcriptional regulator [Xanthomonadales bacterium]|nr:Fis family transcriptional regulator [Xanthomonadales bacterium]